MEAQMTRTMSKGSYSDSIPLKGSYSDPISVKVSTGDQSAGNGGNGYNYGDITNKPTIYFDPYNKASGAEVKVNTGDHVSQKAYWNADGGDANAYKFSKAYGGYAESSGDQSSYSGYDTSKVYANTTASQPNYFYADQHQYALAGIGGDGGYGYAHGGDISLY
jgi:hypothetical protein